MRSPNTIEMSVLNHTTKYDDEVLVVAASADNWEVVRDGLESRHVNRDVLHELVQIACIQNNLVQVKYLFRYDNTLMPRILIAKEAYTPPLASKNQTRYAFEKTLLKLNFPDDSAFLRANLLAFFNPREISLDFILRLVSQALSARKYDKSIIFFLLCFVNFAKPRKVEIALNQKLDVLDSFGSWGEAKIIGLNEEAITVNFAGRPDFYNETIGRSLIPDRCAHLATHSRFQLFFQITFEKNYLDVATELVRSCNMPPEALIVFNKLYRDAHWKFVREYLSSLGKSRFTTTFLHDLIMRAMVTDLENSALEFLLEFAGSASAEHMATALQLPTKWQLLLLFKLFPDLRNDDAISETVESKRWVTLEAYIAEKKPVIAGTAFLLERACDANNFSLLATVCQNDSTIFYGNGYLNKIEPKQLMLTLSGASTVSDWNQACDILSAYEAATTKVEAKLLQPVITSAIKTLSSKSMFVSLISNEEALTSQHVETAFVENKPVKLELILQQNNKINHTAALLDSAGNRHWDCVWTYLQHRSINVEVGSKIVWHMLHDPQYPELILRFCTQTPGTLEMLAHCWAQIIKKNNHELGAKLFIFNVKLACEIFTICLEGASKFCFIRRVLRACPGVQVDITSLKQLLHCLIARAPVAGGVYLVNKYRADFINTVPSHYSALVKGLIEYCVKRKAENCDYFLFSIWGRLKGYSSGLKIAATLKMIEKLSGAEVKFTQQELDCLNNGRLREVFNKHHAIDLILSPMSISHGPLLRFF